jgi:hypothetical protein
MRNVALRMMHRDLASAVLTWRGGTTSWKSDVDAQKSKSLANGIMRRVGKRMMSQELALSYGEWHMNATRDKSSVQIVHATKAVEEIQMLRAALEVHTKRSGLLKDEYNGLKKELTICHLQLLFTQACAGVRTWYKNYKGDIAILSETKAAYYKGELAHERTRFNRCRSPHNMRSLSRKLVAPLDVDDIPNRSWRPGSPPRIIDL